MKRFVVIIVVLGCTLAHARNSDHTLGIIISPNEGTPAIVSQGGEFTVLLREKSGLVLVTEERKISLTIEWGQESEHQIEGRCRIPIQTDLGRYILQTTGTAAGQDRVEQAVYVVEADMSDYHVLLLPQLKSAAQWVSLSPELPLNQLTIALIPSPVEPSIEAYRNFLETLSEIPIPTVVVPNLGNSDVFEDFFGPRVTAIFVGPDAILRFPGDDSVSGLEGQIHQLRRFIKASRWSIGVSPSSWESWRMRTQLTLLVDDPLDMHFGLNTKKTTQKNPWNTTKFYFGTDTQETLFGISPIGVTTK